MPTGFPPLSSSVVREQEFRPVAVNVTAVERSRRATPSSPPRGQRREMAGSEIAGSARGQAAGLCDGDEGAELVEVDRHAAQLAALLRGTQEYCRALHLSARARRAIAGRTRKRAAMQTRIPCVLMRGGTSRGPYFLAEDLPADAASRDAVLLAAMGSPHPMQVDGIGGAQTLTSKVAIVSRSATPGVDVDYLFAQVDVGRALVDTRPNCGNMLAGVGPFAIEAGLVPARDGETLVRILNLNTGSRVDAVVRTPGGAVTYEGDAEIPGVPGTAAPIMLRFRDVAGSKTGALFPTGLRQETIGGVAATLVDGAMPMMLLAAAELGADIHATPEALNADAALFARVEALRREAGLRMGLGDVADSVVPKPCLLGPGSQGAHLTARYFTPHDCHRAMAVTGGITIAAASRSAGTLAHAIAAAIRARRCHRPCSRRHGGPIGLEGEAFAGPPRCQGRGSSRAWLTDPARSGPGIGADGPGAGTFQEKRRYARRSCFPRSPRALRLAAWQEAPPNPAAILMASRRARHHLIARTRPMHGPDPRPDVVVETPGGGGNIATEAAAGARADGYTMLMGNHGPMSVNVSLFRNMRVDPERALEPIGLVADAPLIVVVGPKSRAQNLRGLLDEIRAGRGDVTYGSASNGSASHLAAALMLQMAGLEAEHVPFRGAGPAADVCGPPALHDTSCLVSADPGGSSPLGYVDARMSCRTSRRSPRRSRLQATGYGCCARRNRSRCARLFRRCAALSNPVIAPRRGRRTLTWTARLRALIRGTRALGRVVGSGITVTEAAAAPG